MGKGGLNGPDYDALIDDETWAYILRVDESYPPDATTMSVADQRTSYDRMCADLRAPRPRRVKVKDHGFGGVNCRQYSCGTTDVTVVYYHGGGFVLGGLDSHDDVCAEICDRTGYDVISVDYGLAPETVFPNCFHDAWFAFEAIAATRDGDIILCGDSAGGNLAAAVAHHARGKIEGRITGQVLIYPGLGGDRSKGSYVTHASAPHLTTDDLNAYATLRTGGAKPPISDPRFTPLSDRDFSGLPATVIVTAECDPLASDGETYRDALLTAGGHAAWVDVAGMVHGCLRARNMSTRAAGFFDAVVEGVAALGAGQWPYGARNG